MEISNFIDKEYKDYAKYTLYNRAIPSLVDGFKPVQRKAMFCMLHKKDKQKVMSLAGSMISDGYSHGDSSACQAISKMAQDFPGSNNIPYFNKKGNFGNKFIKEPSAPRYIYVKNNPFFKKVFLDKMLEKRDIDETEPKYFLPIIPTILLNGVEGVAVGFATEILPYKLEIIKKYIQQYINQEPIPILKPYYKGYTGKIELEDEKWIMYGKYEVINTTTIHISEIPVQMDREKYLSHLSKLIEKGLISSFTDKSSSKWNITVRLKRKSAVFKDPERYLKLKQILSENITTIDEKNDLKIFKNVYNLLDYFIEFRLKVYTERKLWKIQNITAEIEVISQKIKFIKYLTKINFKKMTYKEIVEIIKSKMDITNDNLKRCMEIKAYNLNVDYIDKLKEKIIEDQKELKYYKNITEKELYQTDLDNL